MIVFELCDKSCFEIYYEIKNWAHPKIGINDGFCDVVDKIVLIQYVGDKIMLIQYVGDKSMCMAFRLCQFWYVGEFFHRYSCPMVMFKFGHQHLKLVTNIGVALDVAFNVALDDGLWIIGYSSFPIKLLDFWYRLLSLPSVGSSR